MQYVPAADAFLPIENIVSVLPCLTYQLFFERQTDAAIAELDDDKRRTLRATLRTVESPPPADFLQSRDSFLGSWANVSEASCHAR
jgi:soluble epoxide hydrolase/lipid-phosphate phosphatase